ncbi:MAG: transporter associated domain-containing protein [Brevinema sp.]
MDDPSCIQGREDLLALFSTLEAEDVLNPISAITVFDIDTPYQEIIDTVKNSSYYYFPIYEEKIDNVVGLLDLRDLVGLSEKDFNLPSLLKAPFFISENMRIDELFIQMEDKMDFVLVVDEHGSVRGFITYNDIREAMFSHKSTQSVDSAIISFDSTEFMISAKMTLEEFNQNFNQQLTSDEYDTIGGFVIEQLTYVPQVDEILSLDGLTITVKKTEGAKLLELAVRLA